ncbi:MAG: hypothetical protein KY437_00130 [Actinobacteria bacterium]|nr:hypothetical protein [Actinomycetota bacterium]
MSSTRWLVVTVVSVIAVAVLAVVITTVREPESYPADSPEGVVQRYLQAVADGDLEAAAQLHTEEFRDRCEDHGPGRVPPRFEDRSFDADLVDTREVDDDTIDVSVRITEFSGDPPFGGGGYDHEEIYRVQRVDGSWLIVDSGWPYYGCPG